MMKHIVFVIGNYKNGGVAMRVTNLANAFADNGYVATILVTQSIATDVFFDLHDNVEIVLLSKYIDEERYAFNRTKCLRLKRIKRLKIIRHLFRTGQKIDSHIERKIKELRRGTELSVFIDAHIESVYIPLGFTFFMETFYASQKTNIKIIYAEKNAPELEFPTDAEQKTEIIKKLNKSVGFVFQTKAEVDFFEGKLKNATVIKNPVKYFLPERYCGVRRKAIVNFCRVSEQKNLVLLIDSFSKLIKCYPEYTLEIYGNVVYDVEQQYLEYLVSKIAYLGLEDSISILPSRSDVHEIVKDCAMFVSSSDFEGLSNSMIEAMAIGLPCVCTDCLGGGAREMISHEENGLLVPMKDVDALYLAMKRMIEDDELRERCSKNAAKVRETLNADNIGKQWIEYIESVT